MKGNKKHQNIKELKGKKFNILINNKKKRNMDFQKNKINDSELHPGSV